LRLPQVVNRFWQAMQRRRRRIESPASDTRESITCVSALLQNGHFMFRSQRSEAAVHPVAAHRAPMRGRRRPRFNAPLRVRRAVAAPNVRLSLGAE